MGYIRMYSDSFKDHIQSTPGCATVERGVAAKRGRQAEHGRPGWLRATEQDRPWAQYRSAYSK